MTLPTDKDTASVTSTGTHAEHDLVQTSQKYDNNARTRTSK